MDNRRQSAAHLIDVEAIVDALPHFEKFASVDELRALTGSLCGDPRFTIDVAGASRDGAPIHRISIGHGSTKALVVGFPHCMEPIGGTTITGLLALLRDDHPALRTADVAWHIVPCIDPDGARLNEGWSQQPFDFKTYMRNFHAQTYVDQVDFSFPFSYKTFGWDTPSIEANVLRRVIDDVRPDFFFSLHDCRITGSNWVYLSRDIGASAAAGMRDLLTRLDLPLRVSSPLTARYQSFGEGIYELNTMRNYYDYLERTGKEPEIDMPYGVSSGDYLEAINPDALIVVPELSYVAYHGEAKQSLGKLREVLLRLDAENRMLAQDVIHIWDEVHGDLDADSPHYRKIAADFIAARETLWRAVPLTRPTDDIKNNPIYGGEAVGIDRVDPWIDAAGQLLLLCHCNELSRLLHGSRQSPAVVDASGRLDRALDAALDRIDREIDLGSLEIVACDRLAKAQLGCGLIALNAVLSSMAASEIAHDIA